MCGITILYPFHQLCRATQDFLATSGRAATSGFTQYKINRFTILQWRNQGCLACGYKVVSGAGGDTGVSLQEWVKRGIKVKQGKCQHPAMCGAGKPHSVKQIKDRTGYIPHQLWRT